MDAQLESINRVNDSRPAKYPPMDRQVEQLNRSRFSLSMHQEAHPVIVPVSFYSLPIYIDALWKTTEILGEETFKKINSEEIKDCFKKAMLILAEAKVCCAQNNVSKSPDEGLPQKNLYFRHELEELSSLLNQLPYPLAIYLDCLGNTHEGKLNVTPVLVEMDGIEKDLAGAISCGPRQLLPLLHLLQEGFEYNGLAYQLAIKLKHLPNFSWQAKGSKFYLTQSSSNFWLTPQGRIALSAHEINIFRGTLRCLNNWYFSISVDFLNGKGSMAQTVQTPEWSIDSSPFRYFCMADMSLSDQKLGAVFGFSFTAGCKVQKSRYSGCFETAYWRGEVLPNRMLLSILYEEEAHFSNQSEYPPQNQSSHNRHKYRKFWRIFRKKELNSKNLLNS